MMTRRDFEAMATNYAWSFAHTREFREVAIIWDHLLRFTGIAKESNTHFDRDKFLATIADRLRETHGKVGLADFNRMAFNRFGKSF